MNPINLFNLLCILGGINFFFLKDKPIDHLQLMRSSTLGRHQGVINWMHTQVMGSGHWQVYPRNDLKQHSLIIDPKEITSPPSSKIKFNHVTISILANPSYNGSHVPGLLFFCAHVGPYMARCVLPNLRSAICVFSKPNGLH